MNKPGNPAERGPETRAEGKKGPAKDAQLGGNRRTDKDLPRGAEGETRRASSMQR